jgi:hypothetical protein
VSQWLARRQPEHRHGAQIAAPTRQAAIKRPLLALFTQPAGEAKTAAG